MIYYLFTIEEEVKKPIPFNLNLFTYEPIEKKIYYILEYNGLSTLNIKDDKEAILSTGFNILNLKTQNPTINLYPSNFTPNGGLIFIKNNICELIINGTKMPYNFAYRGTLRKLIKK